ncbi:hypothetical protein BDP81DRAFT_388850 [Colletotrichum phormii]|uniref:Uncharacterized protein n=1 Tax=Colletotrichum phormii TaxID=359342 RepID=A0AAJ0EK40_9PEZI|nr:uncharacterized protein BDP81DRAFT_388850 [Colletotrichum phormii]KAK1655995.1 hypothetical protein BDP81DRAFT_388850 [Colletotrichum phormii]
MDAHNLPSVEERLERLWEVLDFLGDTDPASVAPVLREPLRLLGFRAHACRAPYIANVEEEVAMWKDFLNIREEIHRVTNYRRFLCRVKEADTKNLLDTYLSGRRWARGWLPNGGAARKACEQCKNWLPSREQETDCRFISEPLDIIFQDYRRERAQFNKWLIDAAMEKANEPQPPSPVHDFILRATKYSMEHDAYGKKWDMEDVYTVLSQAHSHARGDQITCRDFLPMGWKATMKRINWDQKTVLTRVRSTLKDDETEELVEAIHYDGLMYYVSSFHLDNDGTYVNQQPRQWVINALEANPRPRDIYHGIPFCRIQTVSNVRPTFYFEDAGDITIFCQFAEDGGEWTGCWVGLLRRARYNDGAVLQEDGVLYDGRRRHQPNVNVGHDDVPVNDPEDDDGSDIDDDGVVAPPGEEAPGHGTPGEEEGIGRNEASLDNVASALTSAASDAARRVAETRPFVQVYEGVLRGVDALAPTFQELAEHLGNIVDEDGAAADVIHDEMLNERPGM